MVDCSEYWSNDIWRQILVGMGVIAAPALIGLFVARKSLVYLLIWLLSFAIWAIYMNGYTFEIDGYHGCESCESATLLMLVVSWLSLPVAVAAALVHRFLNRRRWDY